MKVEYDGKRLMVAVGPGERQAALDLVATYIHETESTRRLLMVSAVIFAVVAAILVIGAPTAAADVAQWIGVALVVLACGAAGYSMFRLKIRGVELEAGEGEGSQRNSG